VVIQNIRQNFTIKMMTKSHRHETKPRDGGILTVYHNPLGSCNIFSISN